MHKIFEQVQNFVTTLRHLATHARKLRITGDCIETALRHTRDVCRQLSQNSEIVALASLKLCGTCIAWFLLRRIHDQLSSIWASITNKFLNKGRWDVLPTNNPHAFFFFLLYLRVARVRSEKSGNFTFSPGIFKIKEKKARKIKESPKFDSYRLLKIIYIKHI